MYLVTIAAAIVFWLYAKLKNGLATNPITDYKVCFAEVPIKQAI
jgi:hypothetical protein